MFYEFMEPTFKTSPLLYFALFNKKRLKVQTDVVKQLAAQIERQIRGHEGTLETMPRTDATRHRATLIKLTRDYHRVEMNYKNIALETRRKRSMVEARRREEEEYEHRKKLEDEFVDDNMKRLQIQHQNDVCFFYFWVIFHLKCKVFRSYSHRLLPLLLYKKCRLFYSKSRKKLCVKE